MSKLNCSVLYFLIAAIQIGYCAYLPCSYHDTVDLRNSQKLSNGSYIFDGIEIPGHLVAMYDHEYTTNLIKVSIKAHLRGCICQLKHITCVKWCCEKSQIYQYNDRICMDHNQTINSEVNLISSTRNNENLTKDITEHFYGLPYRRPCKYIFALRPFKYPDDKWHLFENGSMILSEMNLMHSKDEYCMAIDRHETKHNLVPYICSTTETAETSFRDYLYASTLIFSVPCMIITMIIYLAIKELRNLHGKALVCYLLGLSIGYSIMGYILLKGPTEISEETCYVIGFTGYYFFMAAFFWLSVISFDLWWNFSGKKNHSQFSERQRFIGYSIYSWGLAGVFLIFAMAMQNSDEVDDDLKPAIGGKSFCFLDLETNWSAAIYFYGPILVIIIFNIIMFLLTAFKIHQVQCEMSKMMEREDNQRTLKNERDKLFKSRFGLFLRLFIIMGVTWTLEIITYICGKNHGYIELVYICDVFNTLQGLLILVFFVIKKQVKDLICKQYNKSRGRKISRQYSRTTSSNIAMAHSISTAPATSKPLMEKT